MMNVKGVLVPLALATGAVIIGVTAILADLEGEDMAGAIGLATGLGTASAALSRGE